jgi:hypothetical protein
MDGDVRSVYWEAPEHTHIEKTSDWYWILGIVAIAGSVVSIIVDNNVLFSIVILLGAMAMIIASHRTPRIIAFEVSTRGIRIGKDLYPYSTLESFCIDEENSSGPQLLVKSKKLFVPLLILPIPDEYLHEVENMLISRLHEEHMEEPIAHKLLEFLGF